MPASLTYLLKTRRFLPLFCTQFLGAFNDNLYKNALVILITFTAAEKAGLNAQILVTAAAGIFIFPFFLFSATAGRLADKFDKARIIRIIKGTEIIIMVGASLGFYLENVWFLMTVLFLMGGQSAFFGPLKYSILPDHLRREELIGANGLIGAGTFVSILTGTLLGGLLILREGGIAWISGLVLTVAGLGWLASAFIPATRPAAPDLHIHLNVWRDTWAMFRHAAHNRRVFLAILGISWFWLIGATFLAQFPTFAKGILRGNEEIVTLFLTLFSLGIGIGALLCNSLLRGRVNATYVPLAALGMSLFIGDLYGASGIELPGRGEGLIGAAEFLTSFTAWRILFDLLMISVCGGIYIVPLYAILQTGPEPGHRARTIASNNVMNALFMVAAALITMLMFTLGLSVTQVFLGMAIANLGMAATICLLLPPALVQSALRRLFSLVYRVRVQGQENIAGDGGRVVLIANHLSSLDAFLIAAWAPDRLTFVIGPRVARRWRLRPFLELADTHVLDPANRLAARRLVKAVQAGQKTVILPEERLPVTASLMKVYEMAGLIADRSGAQLLPVRIDGAQYTPFTRLGGRVRLRWFPQITLTFLEPMPLDLPPECKGRQRRRRLAGRLHRLMKEMLFAVAPRGQTLFEALIDASRIHGLQHKVAEDTDLKPLTYFQLLTRSFVLGRVCARHTRPGEITGLLLPNAVATLVLFFALQARGRVPALLNFSAGPRNVIAACITGGIRTVYTSRRFIEAAGLQSLLDALKAPGVQVHCLESLVPQISWWAKLQGAAAAMSPETHYRRVHPGGDPGAPAVVLFTSGSAGAPKGVALTHANILANRWQIGAVLDIGPDDVVLNVLPMFHAFGLTAGTLLPVLAGLRTFLYPSPLHYRAIPKAARTIGATLMFGTDTFMNQYARQANPDDFTSLRHVFAGAEPLREETRRRWREKFGLDILEGYGTTETAPVLSLNTSLHHKPGTVGRLLPGIRFRLQPVPELKGVGQLHVSGPNIMAGYLRPERPGAIDPPPDGWFDTGDWVSIDGDGYLTIRGRARRFAKIGGEMVSLTAAEQAAAALWPDHRHAVISLPDARKGERLILVTEQPGAAREALLRHAHQQGLAEIGIPKEVRVVERIPLLSTGKTDYPAVEAMVAGPG
ncbi:MAG: acyl-[ACP]--phospholipid O-acyltransferase [Nitrospinaceae bacterium]